MRLRRLTPDGIGQFTTYLLKLKSEPTLAHPRYLLDDSGASEPAAAELDVLDTVFETRFAAADYLNQLATALDASRVERDAGLWSWLALFYFEQLCPVRKAGMRKPGEVARYIPAIENFQRFYRHLLLGPFLIFRAHADDPQRASAVLAGPLHAPGDIVEQLASRQELITSCAVMGTATALYIDRQTGRPKRGSGGKGGGSSRRLADILNQLDLTYDLNSVGKDRLLSLLPKEFKRFVSPVEDLST